MGPFPARPTATIKLTHYPDRSIRHHQCAYTDLAMDTSGNPVGQTQLSEVPEYHRLLVRFFNLTLPHLHSQQ